MGHNTHIQVPCAILAAACLNQQRFRGPSLGATAPEETAGPQLETRPKNFPPGLAARHQSMFSWPNCEKNNSSSEQKQMGVPRRIRTKIQPFNFHSRAHVSTTRYMMLEGGTGKKKTERQKDRDTDITQRNSHRGNEKLKSVSLPGVDALGDFTMLNFCPWIVVARMLRMTLHPLVETADAMQGTCQRSTKPKHVWLQQGGASQTYPEIGIGKGIWQHVIARHDIRNLRHPTKSMIVDE